MKYLHVLSLVILALLVSSCRFSFKKPIVEKIQDLQLQSISVDNSSLKLSIIVKNPNSYEIRLSKLDLYLMDMNRERVGQASLQKEIILPAKKSINLDFNVSIQTRPMIRMVSSINHDLQFFISGKGEGKAMGISKRFDFEEPYSLKIKDQLMKAIPSLSAGGQDLFKLTRTYVDDYGLSKTILNTDFILINAYGFSFNFKGFPAEIFIDGKKVGTGNLQKQLAFNEKVFYKDGTMVFELSNLKSIFGAVKGAFKGGVKYSVKGKIIIDAMGMELTAPYEYSGIIPLSVWDLLLKQ
jgi:LEA14-like dessication related protein